MGAAKGTMKTAFQKYIKCAPFGRQTQPMAAPLMNEG